MENSEQLKLKHKIADILMDYKVDGSIEGVTSYTLAERLINIITNQTQKLGDKNGN